MNLVRSAVLAAAAPLLLAPLAHAQAEHQAGVYGMVTAHNLGSLTYNTVGVQTSSAVVTRNDGSFSPIGGTFGGYYDFKTLGRVRLGADIRGSVTSSAHGADPTSIGTGGRLYTAMGGVRAAFPAHYKFLAPYVQGSVGLARTGSYQLRSIPGAVAPGQTNELADGQIVIDHGLAYQGLVGLDLHTLPYLDIRFFEFGLGALSGVQNQPGTHRLESVSAGIVLHLPY